MFKATVTVYKLIALKCSTYTYFSYLFEFLLKILLRFFHPQVTGVGPPSIFPSLMYNLEQKDRGHVRYVV